MKYWLSFICFTLFFVACQDEDTPMDTETNKYYADYLAIYLAYDSVGNEATLRAIDGYLSDYPERHEAVLFKAYILAKMGNASAANNFFTLAREMDGLAIESYEYQTAFMLMDTTQKEATKALIKEGLAIDDSSGVLLNNRAWLDILAQDLDDGFMNVTTGVNRSPETENLYRTGFIVANLLENDSAENFYALKVQELEIDNTDSLKILLNNSSAFEVLISLY